MSYANIVKKRVDRDTDPGFQPGTKPTRFPRRAGESLRWAIVGLGLVLCQAPAAPAAATYRFDAGLTGTNPIPAAGEEYVPGDAAYSFIVRLDGFQDLYGYTMTILIAGSGQYGVDYGFGTSPSMNPVVDNTDLAPPLDGNSYVLSASPDYGGLDDFRINGATTTANPAVGQLTLFDTIGFEFNPANAVATVADVNDLVARVSIWTRPGYGGALVVTFSDEPGANVFATAEDVEIEASPVNRSFRLTVVPEPASWLLLAAGGMGAGWFGRRSTTGRRP